MTSVIDRARQAELHTRVRGAVGNDVVIRVQRGVAPMFRHSLRMLALIYWTDKGGSHSYIPLYEQHLRPLRRKPITLLEIGIGGYDQPTWGGASLRMWRDYFRRGEIHGVDVYRKVIDEPRIHVHKGNQTNTEFLHGLGSDCGPFDVIIDDGSHVARDIRTSFEVLFNYLRPGGWYVVEDMGTAYDPAFGGGPPGYPGTSAALVKELVDEVNRVSIASGASANVASLHIYEQIAFIQRA